MAKRATPKRRRLPAAKPHRHAAGRCLHILRELSAFIDDELSDDICGEIRRHVGGCPRCEEFVASLRQTVALCRKSPTPALSSIDRARMREQILTAARAR
ncbi:MAG TPA: zf-HC2 domain-containing protein [Nitrospira sp.]|nr:zf-HC2 domain-containing protein [Nitrospira sp.]